MTENLVRVGLGVVILNKEGKILVGKRKGSHAQSYSIPGGHLDPGETFEEAIIREIREETGMNIRNPVVIGVTNNLETYQKEGRHYISIVLFTDEFSGEPQLMEPEKCEAWLWVDPKKLPEQHFDASRRGVDCFLRKRFYSKYE